MNANTSTKTTNLIQGETFPAQAKHPFPFLCSFLLASATHLYILRKLPEHRSMANLVSRRPLSAITKITSKKNVPEIITFRYATSPEQDEEQEKAIRLNQKNAKLRIPVDCDKVFVPDAGDATKNIKILIMKALNMFEKPNEPAKN